MMGEPPTLTSSTKLNKCRGALFAILMLVSAFLGCVYVLMPLAPLIFLHPRYYRRIVDRLVGFWLVMPSVSLHSIKNFHDLHSPKSFRMFIKNTINFLITFRH